MHVKNMWICMWNSWRHFENFSWRAKLIRVISERKALVTWSTVLCHASKEQFYLILESLSKMYYKVKKWKNENHGSKSKYIKRTLLLQHKICSNSRELLRNVANLCWKFRQISFGFFPKDVLLVDLITLINTIIFWVFIQMKNLQKK